MIHDTQLHYCILPRKVARERGIVHYFTGRECKKNHLDTRLCSTRCCTACAAGASQSWKDSNREKVRQSARSYNLSKREDMVAYNKKYREENRDYFSNYKKENIGKVNSDTARRRSAKMKRTFSFLCNQVNEVYEQASIMRMSGHDVEVDHIIPLQGELVSGLHVPYNLAIIPSADNRSKNNRFTPFCEIYKKDVDGNEYTEVQYMDTNPKEQQK